CFPMVGFRLFLTGCAIELPSRHCNLAVALALIAVAGLSVRSHLRSADWVTAETFYRRTLAAVGTSARNGVNLGLIYANRGDYAEAEKIFRKVIEIVLDYPIAQNDFDRALNGHSKSKESNILFALVGKSSMQTSKEY